MFPVSVLGHFLMLVQLEESWRRALSRGILYLKS